MRIELWKAGCAPYGAQCGGQAEPTLDVYAAEGARGAVVVCPGGAYGMKAPHEGRDVALMLQAQGISAYVLDYRVARCPHDTPITDARRAIRVVRSLGYEKVAIMGFSAGGNLACNAALQALPGDRQSDDPVERLSSRPDALVSCYSVVSFCQFTHIGSVCNLLGDAFGDLAMQRRYSAELHVAPDSPPAFIWHTAEDATVPVESSLLLAMAYSRCGVPYALHVFPEGAHGLGLAPEQAETGRWGGLCVSWLRRQGF